MSWNWYEYSINVEGNTVYNKCLVCNKFPALVITWNDDNEYGPFCKECWIEVIKDEFAALDKKLDNEDWASSPETRKEICSKCNKKDKLNMVTINSIAYDVCWDCFKIYGNY